MAEKPNLVHVEIFGQTYAVRAGGEPNFVEELAAQVDAQMREVSKQSGAVDTVRIAVLAALNIAAELREARARIDEADDRVRLRAEMLARVLSSAIDG
jgi:cell division protein ZapA